MSDITFDTILLKHIKEKYDTDDKVSYGITVALQEIDWCFSEIQKEATKILQITNDLDNSYGNIVQILKPWDELFKYILAPLSQDGSQKLTHSSSLDIDQLQTPIDNRASFHYPNHELEQFDACPNTPTDKIPPTPTDAVERTGSDLQRYPPDIDIEMLPPLFQTPGKFKLVQSIQRAMWANPNITIKTISKNTKIPDELVSVIKSLLERKHLV